MAAAASALDPLRLHRSYARYGHRRRRQRRFCGQRRSAGSRARLPRRPDNIVRDAQRPRIHGPRAGRITRYGVKLFVTESHKALKLALPRLMDTLKHLLKGRMQLYLPRPKYKRTKARVISN